MNVEKYNIGIKYFYSSETDIRKHTGYFSIKIVRIKDNLDFQRVVSTNLESKNYN